MDFELLDSLIQSKKEQFWEMSDQIWGFAEMRFKEDQSSRLQMEFLRNEGFTVEEGIGDIPTAFSARAGSGRPVIGLLGEYDALPKLSQEADVTVKKPLAEGAPGHGCGHHLLGTGCLEAAVAVKDYLLEHPGQGTIVYFGCPAEEGGAGKAFMVREGCFKDCDICLAWHPYSATFASVSSLANARIIYRFTGKSAHAATSPYLGRSALDAVELMNVGCNYMREHMIPDARVHYAVTDTGGDAPNVVQAHAEVIYSVRAPRVDQVCELAERVHNIARGAALMTETKVEIQVVSAYADVLQNKVLDNLVYGHMKEIFPLDYSHEELDYAEKFHAVGDPGDWTLYQTMAAKIMGENGKAFFRGGHGGCLRAAAALKAGLHRCGGRELECSIGLVRQRLLCLGDSGPFLAGCGPGEIVHRPQRNDRSGFRACQDGPGADGKAGTGGGRLGRDERSKEELRIQVPDPGGREGRFLLRQKRRITNGKNVFFSGEQPGDGRVLRPGHPGGAGAGGDLFQDRLEEGPGAGV